MTSHENSVDGVEPAPGDGRSRHLPDLRAGSAAGHRDIHLSREHVYRLVTNAPQRLNTDVLVALCDILACTPNDLISVVVHTGARAKKTGTDSGPKIGSLRPIRATIRRPKGVT